METFSWFVLLHFPSVDLDGIVQASRRTLIFIRHFSPVVPFPLWLPPFFFFFLLDYLRVRVSHGWYELIRPYQQLCTGYHLDPLPGHSTEMAFRSQAAGLCNSGHMEYATVWARPKITRCLQWAKAIRFLAIHWYKNPNWISKVVFIAPADVWMCRLTFKVYLVETSTSC